MINEYRHILLQILCTLSIVYLVLPPVYTTWDWREDHFKLFDLATEMQKNNTDFYTWLNVQPTATFAEIGKAHRQLVLKLHPATSTEEDATTKFEITNEVAYILRSNTLRPLYDFIHEHKRLPYFKGVFYYYTRYKVICVLFLALGAASIMEYLKAWDKYLTDKVTFDQFFSNAKTMAQKISDRHASATTHKSFIDLGDRTIQCEITKEKEIFLLDENKNRIPLSSSNLLPMPSIFNITLIRVPYNLICKQKRNKKE